MIFIYPIFKVLSVNPEKRKLILTHKKSLLSSKLAVISSYTDVQKGSQIEGFIADVRDKGVLVVFFNNVKVGWLFVDSEVI